ncbi:hypothetical protein DPMN_002967 [Dreissena polymorpha]|uniref:Uncharacterized protein n=1 Tax=Dreissena polymorpha TaxID=45954 RepID=A0A9D4MMK8_DREPO|nr:hypothetical protein DPMN_002967 [Dreissena polymorpha]
MTFRSPDGHHIHYTTETSKSKAAKSLRIPGVRLRDVELYVGLSEAGLQSREGFHPGEIGVSYTFELATPVYGEWVRITRSTPNDVLTLCEVEVEGAPYSAANGR